ncbi:hypothetical protein D9M68_374850 [compost metagenome]
MSGRLCVIQLDQDLATFDVFAVNDLQLRNDTAFEMLDHLALALDLDDALRDCRTVERRQSCPAAEDAKECEDHHTPDRNGGL